MDFPLEIAFGYVGHLCLFVTVVFTVIISYIGLASYLLCVQNVLTIIWFTIFMLVLQRQHYYFIIVTIGSIRTPFSPLYVSVLWSILLWWKPLIWLMRSGATICTLLKMCQTRWEDECLKVKMKSSEIWHNLLLLHVVVIFV